MNLTISLPFEVLFVLYTLQQNNFEAYIVGGAVRDLLIKAFSGDKIITDYDFTTNATPEEIQKIFPLSFYENEYGTVSINYHNLLEQINQIAAQNQRSLPKNNLESTLKLIADQTTHIINLNHAKKIHESLKINSEKQLDQNTQFKKLIHAFEITTYRSDGLYKDFRRPEKVIWGKNVEEELGRRDFTINAMAIKLDQNILTDFFLKPANQAIEVALELKKDQYTLIDKHQGLLDLSQKKIRTVGLAKQRFLEDALRMMRAIRFSAQLNFDLEPTILAAIKKNAYLIKKISPERIRDELLKIIITPECKKAMLLLDETGLLDYLLPEFQKNKGIEQGGHHQTDVWTHSLDAMTTCPSTDPIVRLATLLHDVAKAQTYQVRDNKITFYNHEILGSRIVNKIAKRYNFSRHEQQRLFILVRYHMFYYQTFNTDAAIRRIMRKIGLENVNDILALREGDRVGSGAKKTSWRLEELKKRMIAQLNQPMEIRDLAINGDDLMNEFKLKPGPQLGKILQALLEKVLDEPKLNSKEKLLAEAKKMLA